MPARSRVVNRTAWQRTPRSAGPPTKRPGRWARAWNVVKGIADAVKGTWKAGVAICTAIGGLVGFVATIDIQRHHRLEAIRLTIDSLYSASDVVRSGAFTSLEGAAIAEHLEPNAIQGLRQFVQRRATAASPACATARTNRAPSVSPAELSRALNLIATFQAPNHTHHSYPDRVIDAFLVRWHGHDEFKALPFALARKDLRDVNFRTVKMDSASFAGACLTGADFDSTALNGARLDSAVIDGASFTNALLRSASFVDAHGDSVAFDHADLTDAKLDGATLLNASLFDADLSCATLGNAVLEDAYFSTANLRWAFLGGAHLARVHEWNEVEDFTSAFLGGARGLSAADASLAHGRGAVPDSVNSIHWAETRNQQFAPGGACGPHR